MPILTLTKMAGKYIVAAAFLCVLSNSAWAYGTRDPILETQSKAVPVTEETLKEDSKSGAPAPTFKLVHDTSDFFVKAPVEVLEEESVKKWGWLEPSSEEKQESSISNVSSDITYYE